MGTLVQQADEELTTSLRLLRGIAAQPLLVHRDEIRDLLIEARLHTAAADNHVNLLQIQLERVARTWEREPERNRDFGQGRDS